MPRARNIKPALFKNELLGEADPLLTILFSGLWCLADRDGKIEDRPKRIKAEIFPYRELPDFNGYLTELERLGFLDRYKVAGQSIIQVLNFAKHQSPHKTEKGSDLPDKPLKTGATVNPPLDNEPLTEEAALIPDSLNLIPEVKKAKAKRFTPPTLDEVMNYMKELKKGNSSQAESFVDHFSSNGWKVGGKAAMKDWKAAVRNWLKRQKEFSKEPDYEESPRRKHLKEKYGDEANKEILRSGTQSVGDLLGKLK